MPRSTPLDPLLARLRTAGFEPSYVRRTLLPPWWDDEIATTENGFYTAMNYAASRLGVTVAALRGSEPLVLKPNCSVRRKLAKATSTADVRLAEVLALRVAEIAARAARAGVVAIPDARTVRQRILATGAPWVGFVHLLDWCWASGIVVVHISDFPRQTKKPHGLATVVNGRPAIILCWKQRSTSWLLFHLAHELGHLALDHIADGAMIIDEKIETESRDAEEVQANSYALTIITGRGDAELKSTGRWPVRAQMVTAAREYGAKHHVDPGHVALNYARTMTGRTGARFFALAGAVLKEIESGSDAIELILARLRTNLDWESLHEDARAFLEQATGMPG